MRQASDSPLVYLAGRARVGLPIETGMYGSDVLVIFEISVLNNLDAAKTYVENLATNFRTTNLKTEAGNYRKA